MPTNAPARLADGAGGDGARFWYWFGASGRRYIHSVYDLAAMPLLPGAVFVAVRPQGGGDGAGGDDAGDGREALACGILPAGDAAAAEALLAALERSGAQEVHLHVLAGSPAAAREVCRDIRSRLGLGAPDMAEGGGAEEGDDAGAQRSMEEVPAPLLEPLEPLLERAFSAGRSLALRCPGLPR